MTPDDGAIQPLVARAQSGDPEAFGELFDQYHLPVYRYVASRIRHPSDAEDLTQTVFMKALEALPRYESRGIPFGGWLFRLARNAVIDFVRTHREHVELDALIEQSDGDPGPAEALLTRVEIEAVGRALAALTDEQREVVALRFFAGLSSREAAEAMGKQEGTIRGLQFRALAALRRQLGDDAVAGPDSVAEEAIGTAASQAPPTGGSAARNGIRAADRAAGSNGAPGGSGSGVAGGMTGARGR